MPRHYAPYTGRSSSHPNPMRYYPPLDDEKRCKGKSRTTGERCFKWAIKGSDRCRTHGGRKRMLYSKRSIYTARAKGRFKEILEKLSEQSPDERINLADEVDVMRITAEQAVNLFQKACFNEDSTKKVSSQSKALAIGLVQSALASVGSLVEKAAKVAALSDQSINPKQVQFIFDQLTEILRKRLEEHNPEALDAILTDMDEIRVQSREQSLSVIVG